MKPQGLRKECQESSGSLVWNLVCLPFNIWLWMATIPFRILFYLLKFDFKEWAESVDKERAEHEKKLAELETLKEEKAKRELENKAKVEHEAKLKREREQREQRESREAEVHIKEREERKRQREFDQNRMFTQDKGRARPLEIPLQVFTERFAKEDSWMPPDLLNTLSDSQVREVQKTVLTPFEPLESILPRREFNLKPMESEHLNHKKEPESSQPEVPLKKKSKKKNKARKNKQAANAQIVPVTLAEPEVVFDEVMQELLETFMQMPEVFTLETQPTPMKAAKKALPVTKHEEERVPSFIAIKQEDRGDKKEKKVKEEVPKKEEERSTHIPVNKKSSKSPEMQRPKERESHAPQLSQQAEERKETPKFEKTTEREESTASLPLEDTLKGKESTKREEPEKRKKRRGHPVNWERTIGTEIPDNFSVV